MAKLETITEEIASSLDRFGEAHFWIHTLEEFYHFSDPFRWHLNAFLKAIKEIPNLLSVELQNHEGFPEWFRTEREKLKGNVLLSFLSKQRDFVVHRGMLVPKSHGGIGCTEGRGFKVGISLPINPRLNSDEAMHRYLFLIVKDRKDPLSLLKPDDDSVPCVHRVWRLDPFDEELVELASRAWLQTGETLTNAIRWLGAEPPELALSCRHSAQQYQFKTYDRKELRAAVRNMRKRVSKIENKSKAD